MIYVISIYGEAGVFDALPEARQNEVMEGHVALQAALRARGDFISIKLMPPSAAVTIDPALTLDQPPLVVDGPFAETKESFLGLYAAEFSDLEEALDYAKMISSPVARLEVRPAAWAGGAMSLD